MFDFYTIKTIIKKLKIKKNILFLFGKIISEVLYSFIIKNKLLNLLLLK